MACSQPRPRWGARDQAAQMECGEGTACVAAGPSASRMLPRGFTELRLPCPGNKRVSSSSQCLYRERGLSKVEALIGHADGGGDARAQRRADDGRAQRGGRATRPSIRTERSAPDL
jgi:hypothetical protein